MEVSDLEDEIQGLNARRTRIEEEINGITEFIESKKEAIKDGEATLAKYEKQIQNNSTPDSTRGGGGGGPAFGDAWGGEVNLDTLVGSAFAVGTVIG